MAKITSRQYSPCPPNIGRAVISPRGDNWSRMTSRSMAAATVASCLLPRHPTIHRPVGPGHPLHPEPIDHEAGEGLAADECRHVEVEPAAVAEHPLDRVEPP